ncbi:alpha/beta fold hydrolase [Kitasatospora aburaviensis]
MSPAIPADYEPLRPVEQLDVRSADGIRLHVEVHGQPGAPTVVLAHGWTCSTRFWAPVIRRLVDRYRVVAYDQRGHGRSEIPPSAVRYSTRALAEDLSAVLTRTVPAGERALLAGHSMGGMTIMAAGGRPEVAERTAAAVLVSTGPSDLIAELRVLPGVVRSPGLRRFLHRQVLRSRLPLGPVGPASRSVLKYATMGAGSPDGPVEAAARIVHSCPTGVRAAWAGVLGSSTSGRGWPGSPRRPPSWSAPTTGSPRRCTPTGWWRRWPTRRGCSCCPVSATWPRWNGRPRWPPRSTGWPPPTSVRPSPLLPGRLLPSPPLPSPPLPVAPSRPCPSRPFPAPRRPPPPRGPCPHERH